MCGYEEEHFNEAKRLAALAAELDEVHWVMTDHSIAASKVVEELHRRANELAGDRADEIYGEDDGRDEHEQGITG
jgi:hypothetical protein